MGKLRVLAFCKERVLRQCLVAIGAIALMNAIDVSQSIETDTTYLEGKNVGCLYFKSKNRYKHGDIEADQEI